MAAPQEQLPRQSQQRHPSQDVKPLCRGRGRRAGSKIQGAWALPPRFERGRGRARGRGQPGRGRGRQPFLPENLGISFEDNPGPFPSSGWSQAAPNCVPQPERLYPQSGGGYPYRCPQDQHYGEMSTREGAFGQPQNVGQQFVFVQPDEEFDAPKVTEPTMIEADGEHEISSEPSGVSKIKLIKHFLDEKDSEDAFRQLDEEINWKQQINKNRAGKDYEEPRLVCWYGEHPYAYSKVRMEANEEWPPVLKRLKEKIERETSFTFNSVLANKYRSERDGVAWHSDDEYGLRKQPKIASLSLGETRMFEMRKKPPKGYNPYEYDYSMSEKLKIPLTHGCLLLMTGHTQDDWQHQVPKEYHEKKTRINLTFRTIYPDKRHNRNANTYNQQK